MLLHAASPIKRLHRTRILLPDNPISPFIAEPAKPLRLNPSSLKSAYCGSLRCLSPAPDFVGVRATPHLGLRCVSGAFPNYWKHKCRGHAQIRRRQKTVVTAARKGDDRNLPWGFKSIECVSSMFFNWPALPPATDRPIYSYSATNGIDDGLAATASDQ